MPEPEVYLIAGVTPEVNAYAMARYSRSALSMRESLREIDGQRAEKFLNTFYFQYGHRSIADLAHVSLALERLSILAAIEVADESRWDGQERSTRYQDFRRSGYVTPAELGAAHGGYADLLESLFATYAGLNQRLVGHLAARHPQPESMTAEAHLRALRARAFDIARYLLPLATATSLGQIVSARTLESQISRLLSSPLAEVRGLGAALKQAAGAPGALPTLVKYAEPAPYIERSRHELEQAAADLLRGTAPDSTPGVTLGPPPPLEIEVAASLLYPHCHHSYRQVVEAVGGLEPARRDRILDLGRAHRGAHDELLPAFRAGAALQFDILMDIGGFRDLHRHRRCVQLHQAYTPLHGYDQPAILPESGESAVYTAAMGAAGSWVQAQASPAAVYALPLGYRKRTLFKMDWAEAAYIAELRTGLGGHFSYRATAWAMFEAMRDRFPALARALRVTNPAEHDDPLRR